MDLNQIHIKRLDVNDAETFRALRLEALQTDPLAFGSDYKDEVDHPLPWFANRISSSGIFMAFHSAEPLGLAAVTPHSGIKRAHIGVIWSVYVSPKVRKKGVGRQLMNEIVSYSRQHFELLQLTVSANNRSARKLYDSLGFSQYGLEKYAYKIGTNYEDDELMVKFLKM